MSTGSRLVSFQLSTKDICEFVDNNAAGTSPVVSDNNVFYAARIMATAQIPDSAYVRHILLQNGMENKADSLLNLLSKGESFSNLCRRVLSRRQKRR